MQLKQIKISDWDIVKTNPKNGEENAAIISFRLSNIIGIDSFVKLFTGVKATIEEKTAFNFLTLGTYILNVAAQIYRDLKEAKKGANQ